MATFSSLPPEIWSQIVTHFRLKRDLISLRSASRQAYHVTVPVVLRDLTIRLGDLEDLPGVCQAIANLRIDHGRFIRSIHFVTPDPDELANDDARRHPHIHASLKKLLCALSRLLEGGGLEAFSWKLRLGLPLELLDRRIAPQIPLNRLRSLSITAGNANRCEGSLVALSSLRCLQELSWKGIDSLGSIQSLDEALGRSQSTIQVLELGLHPWKESEYVFSSYQRRRTCAQLLESRVLYRLIDPTRLYPKLESLSLSNIDLGSIATRPMTWPIEGLGSLKVESCPNSLCFLRQ